MMLLYSECNLRSLWAGRFSVRRGVGFVSWATLGLEFASYGAVLKGNLFVF